MTAITRRKLLRQSALGFGAAALGGPLVAACGSSSSGDTKSAGSTSSSPGTSKTTSVSYQLAWLSSVQFGGSYLAADHGYWKDLGLDVLLLPGGPNVDNDAETATGKALCDLSEADITAHSNSQGADLKIIAQQYQKAPQTILSLAKAPIKDPSDLVGKKIGIGTADEPGFKAFCTVAKVDYNSITKVPTQYSPAPLVAGQVDGLYCFLNDLPIALEQKGIAGVSMLLADFGYTVATDTYTVDAKTLSDASSRATLVAFMKGEIMGWEAYKKDPEAAAVLTLKEYPKAGLDLPTQKKVATVSLELLFDSSTAANGYGWFTDDDIQDNLKLLKLLGVPAQASMWDRSILEEIYAHGPTIPI